ncbi:short-chain dehydrogenase [Lophiostoma macrostomum CBS 122681]|uniref:Short-chain dehydrogenase n=1 Tax=Lophiostoma macrostomum CBS 122681 TaxID=1314788 RepID=A0A6A6TM96_9PLEO|nr:short-chain dehydrogenase [Lophiostoma macrostomum CBS 122681]
MAEPQFNFSTTAEEVASYHSSHIHNKTILITGVSPNGIGFHTVQVLAAHSPALLILAGRSESTLSAVRASILEKSPTCPIKLLTLDLSSISTVRAAATTFNSWDDVPKLDILINNAAVMNYEFSLGPDGIESQFATNHIGPWLFTNLLVPKLLAAKGRVVFLSSIGHMYSPVRYEDYNFETDPYNPDLAYGASKTAAILTARTLTQKLSSRGLTAFSVHPGLILTPLIKNTPASALRAKGFLDEHGNVSDKIPQKTLSQGSATTLVAALDPELEGQSGAYLTDCGVEKEELVAEWAKDVDGKGAERLWGLSEKLVGEEFRFD